MRILDVLLEISLYATIVYLAIALLKKCFYRKMSPMLHYGIWILLIARLVMPFTIDSGINLIVVPAAPVQAEQTIPPDAMVDPNQALAARNDINTTTANANAQPQPLQFQADNAETSPVSLPLPVHDAGLTLGGLYSALLILWFSGMLISLVYMAVSYVLLRKRITRNALPPSEHLQKLFDQCKRELGIRGNVRIRGIYGLSTPALFIPATILMPMETLVVMDDTHIHYALRHELIHYRRKDHVVNILLCFLQAIYWFNPFVWMAFRQIRLDMEVACDHAVVKRLSGEEKSNYAVMILSLFARTRHGQIALGLAQGRTKRTAENRIRGIFMEGRSRHSAKFVSILLAVVLFVGCFTTACQPTPEEPPVMGKNNGVLEEKIEQTALPEKKYEAPPTWKGEYTQGKLSVHIDATVEMPDIAKYPVAKVVPDPLTQEKVDHFVKVLMQGQTIYPIRDMDQDMTKAEIIDKMAELTEGKNSDLHALDPEAYKEFIKPQLAELEAKLPNAPETIERIPSDGKLQQALSHVGANGKADPNGHPREGYYRLGVEADLGQEKLATIQLSKTPDDKNNMIFFQSGAGQPNRVFEEKLDNLPGLSLSSEQGADIAQKLVNDLGFGDMHIAATASCAMPTSDQVETLSYDEFPRCYAYFFTHTVQDMPANYFAHKNTPFRMGENAGTTTNYNETWIEEYLEVYVNDTGVIALDWRSPTSTQEIVSENVELLPFDQIQERFTQQMKYEGVWDGEDRVDSRNIYINKVSLGLARVPSKDHPDEYLYVPAWDFYGTNVEKLSDEVHDPNLTENNEDVQDDPFTSYLTLNAIDGTVIERNIMN